MVVLKNSEDRECIVRLALEAALQPEFQDLQVVCKDGVLGVCSFILGALRYDSNTFKKKIFFLL